MECGNRIGRVTNVLYLRVVWGCAEGVGEKPRTGHDRGVRLRGRSGTYRGRNELSTTYGTIYIYLLGWSLFRALGSYNPTEKRVNNKMQVSKG